MELFNKIMKVGDTTYGYNRNALGELVVFIKKELPYQKEGSKRVSKAIETQQAIALPLEIEMYLDRFSYNEPVDKDESGLELYEQIDIEKLKKEINDEILGLLTIQLDESGYYDAYRKRRASSLENDVHDMTVNLKSQGWHHIWSIKDYLLKTEYWLHTDVYNHFRLGIVRYSKSRKANNKLDILDFTTYVFPGNLLKEKKYMNKEGE